MGRAPLEPWLNSMELDEAATLRSHRYSDRFSAVRVATTGRLPGAVQKSSSVTAALVSVSLAPIAAPSYRLWVDGKRMMPREIPAFRAHVIDLAAEPAMWADRGFEVVHFHVRRAVIDAVARELGYEKIGELRVAVAEEDAVLAQIARNVGRHSGPRPPLLALDQLELTLAAHLMQRYGNARRRATPRPGGLAAWQRLRVTEFLRERLDGKVRLAELAELCELSVSRFAHSFKTTFGVSAHHFLLERRIERARELLAESKAPLSDIASQCGFADQAAFTRTFHRIAGASPGRWRREHGALGSRLERARTT
ncbi:MAG TPA: AraC family transcriptional regulator [Polyangiaceae bacterium]|nr:AraC family transcriptional regulator [Polyangiaceae bacterium]